MFVFNFELNCELKKILIVHNLMVLFKFFFSFFQSCLLYLMNHAPWPIKIDVHLVRQVWDASSTSSNRCII